ncbi:MAG: hypothetical protein AAF085_04800, partial [Planctomycetota bacterium]
PVDLDKHFREHEIHDLRNQLCDSGAIASGFTTGSTTSDFALADLLKTSSLPDQMMVMASSLQAVQTTVTGVDHASERLIAWLVLLDGLADGGRVALQHCDTEPDAETWSQPDCRAAVQALKHHADLIDGLDLLRLQWPTVTSHWLNQLRDKPVRTRANVLPSDVPPTFVTPRMLDRVVHKVRRTIRGAA